MRVTWKKWICFCILAIALGAAAHMAGRRYLMYAGSDWSESVSDEITPDGLLKSLLSSVYVRPAPPVKESTVELDLENSQTTDPETLMGIALVGPVVRIPREGLTWKGLDEYLWKRTKRNLEWFLRVSALGLKHTKNPVMKRELERLMLYCESVSLWEMQWCGMEAGEENSSPVNVSSISAPLTRGEEIWRRSRQIDPDNALYFYDKALRELEVVIADVEYDPPPPTSSSNEWVWEPNESVWEPFALKNETLLLPTARKVDETLSSVGGEVKLRRFRSYQRHLVKKAYAFRYPSPVHPYYATFATAWRHNRDLGMQKGLVRRLCFVAGRLIERGEDALGLRMYYHVYNIGKARTVPTGEESSLLDALVGSQCLDTATDGLMEYWANRGDAEKVMEISDFEHLQNWRYSEVKKGCTSNVMDPGGRKNKASTRYLRVLNLIDSFGTTGLVAGALSLLCTGLYFLCKQRGSPSELVRASRKELALLAIAPTLVMIWFALLVPLPYATYSDLPALLVWGYVLALGWVVAAGMLSPRLAARAPDVRKSATALILPVLMTAAVLVATVAAIRSERPVTAAAAALISVLGSVVVWGIAVIVAWSTRSTLPDRTYRSAVRKTFAFCSMFVAVVALLGALVSIPLMYGRQQRYFNLVEREELDEVRIVLGEHWPESFEGLSPELFSVGEGDDQKGR